MQWLSRALFLLAVASACGGGDAKNGGPDDDPADDEDETPDRAIEGELGLLYVPGVECFSWDAAPRAGTDIWVGPEGSDANNGNTRDMPLKTLASALCQVAPGQTVHVLPGTYHESVLMGLFGDASKPITIIGEMDGAQRPILDGQRRLTMGLGILGDWDGTWARSFVVENLEFRNYTDQGLLINLADDVTVRNCRFESNGFHSISEDAAGEGFSLLLTSASNLRIISNEVTKSGPEPDLVASGLLGTAINAWGVSDSLIQGNHCHHNIGAGILAEECVNVEILDNEISDSLLHSEYLDGGIWLDGGHHVTVTGNHIHDNDGAAIQVSDTEVHFPYSSCRYTVIGNRIERNWWALSTFNMGACPLPDETYLVWADNELVANAYPGDVKEYKDATKDQLICFEWPCGEGQPCVEPDEVPEVDVCH